MRGPCFMVAGVLATGCHAFFGLDPLAEPPREIDAPTCPSPCTAPSGNDEDGDTVSDRCDTCPAIAGQPTDLDCDGLGASCDPDETVRHAQQFFGFDVSPQELRTIPDASFFQQGELVATFAAETFVTLFVEPAGARAGWYETAFELRDVEPDALLAGGLRLYASTPNEADLFVRVRLDAGVRRFEIKSEANNVGSVVADAVLPATSLHERYVIRATVAANRIDATLTYDVGETVSLIYDGNIPPTGEWGVSAHVRMVPTNMKVAFAYASRVVVAP